MPGPDVAHGATHFPVRDALTPAAQPRARPMGTMPAILLRARYAMSGTEIAYGAACLRMHYTMPGTDLGYAATRRIRMGKCGCFHRAGSFPAIVLRAPYAMSGTDICYTIPPFPCDMSGTDVGHTAVFLHVPDEVSCTDICYTATTICVPYDMSGTDVGYAATRRGVRDIYENFEVEAADEV
eukprot:1372238-Rhodomonas_salina.6